jgi:hypothetical protein
VEAGELVEPLDAEAVVAQRLVLGADLLALLLVDGEAVAAGTAKRIPGERLDPVERALGPPPELTRPLIAVRVARDVVPRGAAAKREAAVPSACALGDPACIVDADAEARPGEPQGRAAAGDAGADDRDIDPSVVTGGGWKRDRVFEPVRVQEVER